jgi:hypothetical protein
MHERAPSAKPEERGVATDLNIEDARIARDRWINVKITETRFHEIKKNT